MLENVRCFSHRLNFVSDNGQLLRMNEFAVVMQILASIEFVSYLFLTCIKATRTRHDVLVRDFSIYCRLDASCMLIVCILLNSWQICPSVGGETRGGWTRNGGSQQ